MQAKAEYGKGGYSSMKKGNGKWVWMAGGLLAAFAVWTVLISFIDVQAIGPRGSEVGFATFNRWFHRVTGVHMWLYTLTDWLGLAPIGVAFCFAVLGLLQWIERKQILKVDRSILLLGGFYIAVIAVYMLFETVVVNYRPVLIEGYLEASYPSSTTVLVMCVIPTAMMQLHTRIKKQRLRRSILFLMGAFIGFMVIGRLVSGVHWVSDIIGGLLVSAGLVAAYYALLHD